MIKKILPMMAVVMLAACAHTPAGGPICPKEKCQCAQCKCGEKCQCAKKDHDAKEKGTCMKKEAKPSE